MVIRYTYMTMLFCICILSTNAQSVLNIDNSQYKILLDKKIRLESSNIFNLDIEKTRTSLRNAPMLDENRYDQGVALKLTLEDGTPTTIYLHEAPISHPDHYKKYPDNKTYKITGSKPHQISGRFAISPRGIRGLMIVNGKSIFVEPLVIGESEHVSYLFTRDNPYSCDADMTEVEVKPRAQSAQRSSGYTIGNQLRTYRIALASTNEWSAERGNNLVTINDDINLYLSELNAIYENDLAITFQLIANNDDIVYLAGQTDPFNPASRTATAHSGITNEIGSANFDIGHVFYEIPTGGGSGIAGLGVVCKDNRKAEGWTGWGGNYSTAAFMGIFAHEVGHQFEATHSFYGTAGFCAGFNRSAGAGYEPGSGNSLMSYEGICPLPGQSNGGCATGHNIVPIASSVYFHAFSVEQIYDYINIPNINCAAISASGNTPPVVTAPANKSIPRNTPFELQGAGSDANGDAILYNWEEYDTDTANLNCPDGEPNDAANSTTAPLFRSVDPSASGSYRSFPAYLDLKNNTQTMGEILPNVARSIKMRLTGRDFNASAGGVHCDDVTLTVVNTPGPFEVTVANSPDPGFQAGSSLNVTWSVSNTNNPPINASLVNILWSNDSGESFPITLASNVSNDGSYTINLPGVSTTTGRIKIKPTNNYFFDINNYDITLINGCDAVTGAIINNEALEAEAGSIELDLTLVAGSEITSASGTLDANDPVTSLSSDNQSMGTCVSFGNAPLYDIISFTVDVTGSYRFVESTPTYSGVMNLYTPAHNPANVCENWIASNGDFNGSTTISLNPVFDVNLTAGENYDLKISGFSGSNTGAYTITMSNSIGGTVYDYSGLSGGGYALEYVVVTSGGIIKGIDEGPDMTNGNTYGNDTYTIYALSYIASTDLSSYVNGTLSNLQSALNSGSVCGALSNNTKTVTVTGGGCTPTTKIVTSTEDDGSIGSLRSILTNTCSGDIITFNLPSGSTVNLSNDIVLEDGVTIDGSGVTELKISGGFMDRILTIPTGVTATIKDVELMNGFSSPNGGAFYNEGTVRLDNVSFMNNFHISNIQPFTGNGEVIIMGGTVLIKAP